MNGTPPPRNQPAVAPHGLRALRGATTVAHDESHQLLAATRELLAAMLARNALDPSQIVSIIFTTTRDLTSADPSPAARALGWQRVPVLCMSEIAVPDGLPRCIRVLMHVDVPRDDRRTRPVYLRDATTLRPDIAVRG